MPKPRKSQIALESTPYYHCISRCVRRAFLCGDDHYSGRNYDHRRVWVQERLALLDEVFCIDLCAYALMANHSHLVMRVNPKKRDLLSDQEVIKRWQKLFKGPVMIQRLLTGESLSEAEMAVANGTIQDWRERLCSISWFMRCLNEHIARLANEEDCCTGRFWEGRFKCQALLNESALLRCMAYVDLNPIRAGIAEKPETSDFTSIQQRIEEINQPPETLPANQEPRPPRPRLLPMQDKNNTKRSWEDSVLQLSLPHYLDLVDWTGKARREDKAGAIPAHLAPILQRLQMDTEQWVNEISPGVFEKRSAIGPIQQLKIYAEQLGKLWVWGHT